MKIRLASLALVAALMLSFTVGFSDRASAQSNRGGAAGLVAALVQIATDDVVEVNVVDSFNNLRALNNVLNNSPILSNNDIDVTVGDINVLTDFLNNNNITLQDFLNENNIELEDILQVIVLNTDDIVVLI
ncbi:MAG: hypothetical protein M3Q29_03500 [Chloroflexota bacterium]|nr:hypothetical protein [Chloroflexota bacterium]